jgi:hypothetical protein
MMSKNSHPVTNGAANPPSPREQPAAGEASLQFLPGPDLPEDQALAELRQPDVTAQKLAQLARNAGALKSRKVMLALVTHARTPRHSSIPLLRRMFTFDLMQVALTPRVAADIKRAAEEQILLRIEALSAGEKISLARRASGRVAASLLQEADERVAAPALDNPRLTEPLLVQALMKPTAPEALFMLVCRHGKWSPRREVQVALLRSAKTPFPNVRELARHFSLEFVADIVPDERRAALLEGLRAESRGQALG